MGPCPQNCLCEISSIWSTFSKIKSLGPLGVSGEQNYLGYGYGDFPLYFMTNGNLSPTASQKLMTKFSSKLIFAKFS